MTVVEFAPATEADNAFRRWLRGHGLRRDDIEPDDLIVDTGCGDGGMVRRYRVHGKALPTEL